MVYIDFEGKVRENTYLIDGLLFRMPHLLSLYIIENDGERMMIDTGEASMARKVLNKIKELGLYPINKILLTHSHWDHIQAVNKLKKLIKEVDVEILASEKAIENLIHTEKMNYPFEMQAESIEKVTPLKEGDYIDLNGLKLEIFTFFGHTHDSIALLDKKNKNIFVGDAIIDYWDQETATAPFMPPDFNEGELLKTFQKLRDLKADINSISLSHFGVYKDEDFLKILDNMEDIYFKTKDSIIEWYNENPSVDYITSKYQDIYIPNSTVFPKENMLGLKMVVGWMIKGLKISGFIN